MEENKKLKWEKGIKYIKVEVGFKGTFEISKEELQSLRKELNKMWIRSVIHKVKNALRNLFARK